MIRRDQAYWARVRKDARSALAVGSALLASLMALLCLLVPGPQAQARGNPLYWLCILPFAWWANGLAAYEPRPVRPALIVAVATAPASLAIATVLGKEPLLWTIGAGIALISAALAEYFYRGSMLYREGPAR
ncbi:MULTISPECIES: hypothetical protein [Pseudomonadota]|nr:MULTISPECIES: hypothetical protein [Pseudomonadota]